MNNISQNVIPSYKRHITKTHCLHQWYTQKQSCNNVLALPVVYAKQSRNNALPSPVVYTNSHATTRCLHQWYAQNSYATTRCLHRWYTQIVTQRYVAFSSGISKKRSGNNSILPSPAVCARQYRNNKSPSPAEYTIIAMQQHIAFTGEIPQ